MNALMTTEVAAEVLRLAPATLSCWRSNGKGPQFVKCGAAVRYRGEDITAWIELNTVKPEETKRIHIATAREEAGGN